MPHRASLPSSQDPLSLAYDRPSPKARSKSNASVEEHFSGLFRMGRVVASIFDRGRHMKYDYHITQPEASTRHRASAPNAEAANTVNRSQQTSRSSSMTVASTRSDRDRLSVPLSTPSSRRGSDQSTDGTRTRRGGMSVS